MQMVPLLYEVAMIPKGYDSFPGKVLPQIRQLTRFSNSAETRGWGSEEPNTSKSTMWRVPLFSSKPEMEPSFEATAIIFVFPSHGHHEKAQFSPLKLFKTVIFTEAQQRSGSFRIYENRMSFVVFEINHRSTSVLGKKWANRGYSSVLAKFQTFSRLFFHSYFTCIQEASQVLFASANLEMSERGDINKETIESESDKKEFTVLSALF